LHVAYRQQLDEPVVVADRGGAGRRVDGYRWRRLARANGSPQPVAVRTAGPNDHHLAVVARGREQLVRHERQPAGPAVVPVDRRRPWSSGRWIPEPDEAVAAGRRKVAVVRGVPNRKDPITVGDCSP